MHWAADVRDAAMLLRAQLDILLALDEAEEIHWRALVIPTAYEYHLASIRVADFVLTHEAAHAIKHRDAMMLLEMVERDAPPRHCLRA